MHHELPDLLCPTAWCDVPGEILSYLSGLPCDILYALTKLTLCEQIVNMMDILNTDKILHNWCNEYIQYFKDANIDENQWTNKWRAIVTIFIPFLLLISRFKLLTLSINFFSTNWFRSTCFRIWIHQSIPMDCSIA